MCYRIFMHVVVVVVVLKSVMSDELRLLIGVYMYVCLVVVDVVVVAVVNVEEWKKEYRRLSHKLNIEVDVVCRSALSLSLIIQIRVIPSTKRTNKRERERERKKL